MPIVYNPETTMWEAKDLTDIEKDSLLQIAKDSMINYLGEQLAARIFAQAGMQFNPGGEGPVNLEDMDVEDLKPN